MDFGLGQVDSLEFSGKFLGWCWRYFSIPLISFLFFFLFLGYAILLVERFRYSFDVMQPAKRFANISTLLIIGFDVT